MFRTLESTRKYIEYNNSIPYNRVWSKTITVYKVSYLNF